MVLCERFGWTFSEMDEQDMTRVYPAVGAANMRAALQRVQAWADAAAAGRKPAFPSGGELKLWQEARRLVAGGREPEALSGNALKLWQEALEDNHA